MTVAPYKDTDLSHDHVYFGNGCSTGTGSETPCPASDAGGRYVETADGETQKNGTYYNFQAATVGTGSAVTVQNTNVPDTFCPLGWHMPYGGTDGDYYDKSRSWRRLFDIYDITYDDEGTRASATKVHSYPFSYVYSGDYRFDQGKLYLMGSNGRWWSSTVRNPDGSFQLRTWPAANRLNLVDTKTYAYALRCTKFLASNHRRHGGR